MALPFLPGIDVLLARHKAWLAGKRVGLVSHLPAVNRFGYPAADLLARDPALRLKALFGPEHGFFGLGAAGAALAHQRHPRWGIPVYSLYGRQRRPTAAMFRQLDVVVVDLQDLGARPYTFVATLRYVLEQAAAQEKPVIVADRPIPLPRVIDGPLLTPAWESFVGCVRTPMQYGMTPGETALWLKADLQLAGDLRVARLQGYARSAGRGSDWPPWIPPSPGIRSWESARCYLATVFTEAVPAVNCGRGTNLAFQVFGAPWMQSAPVIEWLNDRQLPGVTFHPHPYRLPDAATVIDGVRIAVTDARRFYPVSVSVAILAGLQALYGPRRLWRAGRPDWFDKLYGTDAVRRELQAGARPETICQRWQKPLRQFQRTRAKCLLY